MFPIYRRTSFFVGLEVQVDEIRLLQLKQIKQAIQVTQVAVAELSPHAIVDGRVKQSSVISNIIKQMVQATGIPACSISLALPLQAVMSKRIRLSKEVNITEYERIIEENISHYFPGVSERLNFDFVIMKPQKLDHDILLVAIRHEWLCEYIDVVKATGFKVSRVEVGVYALLRAVCKLYVTDVQQILGIFLLGRTTLQYVAFRQDEILLNQQWQLKDAADLKEIVASIHANQHKNPIQQFYLTGSHTYFSAFLQETELLGAQIPIIARPPAQVQFASHIDLATLHQLGPSLLTCLGLAMGVSKHARN